MTQSRLGEHRDAEAEVEAEPELADRWGDRRNGIDAVAATRLAALLAALVACLVLFTIPTLFVLALIVIVMLHELGHFVTAKRAGMKVTEYFVGFGPRVWSFRRGETEYGIKAIPAGGYVKIIGMTNLEEVDPSDEPRTYRQKSFPRRMSVALAGSAMHFILAFLLLWGLYSFAGTPDNNEVAVQGFSSIGGGPSVARQAGFRTGDIVVSVNGNHVSNFNDLSPYISQHPGQSLEFVVERGGELVHLSAVPRNLSTSASKPEGRIGVLLGAPLVTVNPVVAIGRSSADIGTFTSQTFKGLGHLFSPHGIDTYVNQVVGHTSSSQTAQASRPLSVVGVVRLTSQAAQAGIANLLNLLVFINIFLGIFNLLPMLPLDGGHVAIAVYERIRSRRNKRYYADAAKLMPVAAAATVAILLLGVTAVYLDIAHPLANPFQ